MSIFLDGRFSLFIQYKLLSKRFHCILRQLIGLIDLFLHTGFIPSISFIVIPILVFSHNEIQEAIILDISYTISP